MGFSMDYSNRNLTNNSNNCLNPSYNFAIIGGGVAGLSSANQLADLNQNGILIDAGSYPSHKVCGECISPEALPILKKWNISLDYELTQSGFFLKNRHFNLPLPLNYGSMSRFQLDTMLAKRATKKGIFILNNTKVLLVNKSKDAEKGQDFYTLTLCNGKTIKAKHLLIGVGKIKFSEEDKELKKEQTRQDLPKPKTMMRYLGFKAHFSGINLKNKLYMHLLSKAYLGISNINKNTVNLACIAKIPQDFNTHFNQPELYINQLLSSPEAKLIKNIISSKKGKGETLYPKMLHPNWMTVYIPEFGVRETPNWKNTYFIGDAAGSIPPITGSGLGIAITSGVMAANYAIKNDSKGFKQEWIQRYSKRIQRGQRLHQFVINPTLAKLSFGMCQIFPKIAKSLYLYTRDPNN